MCFLHSQGQKGAFRDLDVVLLGQVQGKGLSEFPQQCVAQSTSFSQVSTDILRISVSMSDGNQMHKQTLHQRCQASHTILN